METRPACTVTTARTPSLSAQWQCHRCRVCHLSAAELRAVVVLEVVDMTPSRDVSPRQFALGRGMWTMTIVIYAFFAFLVVAAVSDLLTNSDPAAVVFEVVWVCAIVLSGLWLILGEPRRVEVLTEGLRFVAPARSVLIPWESLQSVSSPALDWNRQSLHWRFGRRKVHTWGPYDHEFQELLALVRDRAPGADLRGAVTRRPTWGIGRSRPSRWTDEPSS
jgi:hypothetical protein